MQQRSKAWKKQEKQADFSLLILIKNKIINNSFINKKCTFLTF